MRVSPSSDQQEVSIASAAEVQDVIEFLDGGFEYPPEGGGRGDHSKKVYIPNTTYSLTDYQDSSYQDGSYSERHWNQPKPPPQKPNPTPQSDNSSSGSSGVGTDDGYVHVMSSRSTSRSPGIDTGKEQEEGHHGKGEGLDEGKRYYNIKGSIDSGINLHGSSSQKKKGWEREQPSERESSSSLISKELSLDFSKGFGPLISSDPSNMLGLHLLKGMEDSDSERSG